MKKFNFSVCPHDTAKKMVEWFQLNTYLQRRLDCTIRFEPQEDFLRERQNVLEGGFHIVYANPFSALWFKQRLGFKPVARVTGLFDETYLVAPAGAGIPERRPLRIASATDKLIVHTLGLSLLEQLGLGREECEFAYVGNHMKAAQAVIKEEADLGFVFNETWHGMAESTQAALSVIAESTDHIAFHCFMIAPEWADRLDSVRDTLVGMNTDPKGRRILDDLDFPALEPLTDDALERLEHLHEAYAASL